MYILKYKDDSLKIRHYREFLRDLEYDCESNKIQMSDYDLIETHENIIATPTGDIYTESDFETIKKSKEYQDKLAKQERERLNLLSMTKREMFLGLYQAKGISPDMLKAQITDPQALIEFEYANDYYRGNPLIDVIGAKLGFTTEQLDKFFETKDYTYLIPSDQVSDQVTDQVEEQDDNTTDTTESDVQDELDTTTSKSDETNTDILE